MEQGFPGRGRAGKSKDVKYYMERSFQLMVSAPKKSEQDEKGREGRRVQGCLRKLPPQDERRPVLQRARNEHLGKKEQPIRRAQGGREVSMTGKG